MRRWTSGVRSDLLVGAALCILVVLERRRPLRKPVEPSLRREARNLTMAAASGVVLVLVQGPLVLPLARLVARRRIGLLHLVRLPPALEAALAVLLLDYTLYLWHVGTHELDVLWRFHEAHHLDLDVSATTALRFHFGEILLSMPYRALQIVLLGVSPSAFELWQTLTTVQILFHHSNVRLPLSVERWLSWVMVTPRLHGIHHSNVRAESDSNWATLFSFFDRLHRTLRLDVPQRELTMGVPAYSERRDVTLWRSLALPFRRNLWRWNRPDQCPSERARATREKRSQLAP